MQLNINKYVKVKSWVALRHPTAGHGSAKMQAFVLNLRKITILHNQFSFIIFCSIVLSTYSPFINIFTYLSTNIFFSSSISG